MPEFPHYVIYSSRWGWNHGSEFRFAKTDKQVRNMLRGLFARYGPDLDVAVFAVGDVMDVTTRFVLPKETS